MEKKKEMMDMNNMKGRIVIEQGKDYLRFDDGRVVYVDMCEIV